MESLKLPPGFTSWSEVLTESAISRAFPDGKAPPCLKNHPELLAPLARELGTEIRERLFKRRVTAVSRLAAQLTESAVRTEIEEALAAHWKAQPINRMPDTIFADAAFSSPASRLARIHPTWWGRFFGRMQVLSTQGHPAHGELLDALPELTRAPGRYTIEGAIDEWRKTRVHCWGWTGRPENPWVLAARTASKAEKLTCWYRNWAPGYLEDSAERERLHAALAKRLDVIDPWEMSGPRSPVCRFGMHGPN